MAAPQGMAPPDELSELRHRYNQLCAALAGVAVPRTVAADRLLDDLEQLAQRLAARPSWQDTAMARLGRAAKRWASCSRSSRRRSAATVRGTATPASAAHN